MTPKSFRYSVIQGLKSIIRSYGLSYKSIRSKKTPFIGAYHFNYKQITINFAHLDKASKFNPEEFRLLVSAVFHELGHAFCDQSGIYESFNKIYKNKHATHKELMVFKRIALAAELYADKLGQKLMSDFFPDIVYSKSYTNQEDREFLKKHVQTICEMK